MSAEPGTTFGRVAEAYARTRPEYSRPAVAFAADKLGLDDSATVLDLAAGTGKLTRALRGRFTVISVEPDDAMRARIDGEALAGSAEAIPLADGSVDGVFVGEAFHWFDYERALAEIRRVLKPGGGLAIFARGWGDIPPPLKPDLDEVWARFHPSGQEVPDWRDAVRPEGPEAFTDSCGSPGATSSTCGSRAALQRRSRKTSATRSQRARTRRWRASMSSW